MDEDFVFSTEDGQLRASWVVKRLEVVGCQGNGFPLTINERLIPLSGASIICLCVSNPVTSADLGPRLVFERQLFCLIFGFGMQVGTS